MLGFFIFVLYHLKMLLFPGALFLLVETIYQIEHNKTYKCHVISHGKFIIRGRTMKKYLLTMALTLGVICITGCSKDGKVSQIIAESMGEATFYEEDKRVTFTLRSFPYDMEYKKYTLPYLSCELYQEKSDDNDTYTPYVIAKVNISEMDDEALLGFDEDLFVYGKISNDKNQLNKDLSKICKIDHDGYRYYVFSKASSTSDGYKYDFTESSFSLTFFILQGEEYRALQFDYQGYTSSTVKDLNEIDNDIWHEIKQKQLEAAKPKI